MSASVELLIRAATEAARRTGTRWSVRGYRLSNGRWGYVAAPTTWARGAE